MGFPLTAAALLVCSAAFIAPAYPADDARAHSHSAAKKKSAKPVEKSFGREGDARKVKRVVKVEMSDTMRYFPNELRVRRGDTIRFNVHNGGQMPHEMVLGSMDELKKHAEMMRKEHHDMTHDDAYVAHVEPGQTGRIVWQFTRPGEFYFACLIPGHFEAGMIGTIVVR